MSAITWEDLLYPGRAADFFVRNPLPAFEPHASAYSAANAWWLAESSRLIYRTEAAERSALLPVQLQQLESFNSAVLGAQAALLQGREPEPYAVLVFRGTEQKLQDFLHDADVRLVPAATGGAQVHRGFERALNVVWPQIAAALQPLSCPLYFTGHSLGAALAILAATRHAPAAVYAFGAPRVGDARLADLLLQVPIYRIVHADDVVTVLPPQALGFQHVGQELRIGHAVMNRAMLDPRLLLSGFGRPPKPLADHAPRNYSQLLSRA
jgi:hypothetical protein